MDIYSFITSADVAAYCRKIRKEWTPFEMTIIISRSRRSLEERLMALRTLAYDYPDMPVPKSLLYEFIKEGFDSLHKKIAEVLEFEERKLTILKTPEEGSVYTYGRRWEGKESYSFSAFSTFEAVFNCVSPKRFDKEGCLCAYLDTYGNIHHVELSPHGRDEWFEDFGFGKYNFCCFSKMSYVDVPVPFVRGDILVQRYPRGYGDLDRILVIDYLEYDDKGYIGEWGERNKLAPCRPRGGTNQ